ncbi:hypothetical protein BHECKSOX_372 [Bathymodiolus heckerae thiotrophic gill symbiont]|uniref:DUF7683 domain-containing protein n=1 Tax=Bathymodiolus heckerae thiotrophic gill symbiont TaxID=1052212 RepID=UPI0010AF741A|nr:hypothetical protein [Bathymodiolus heckerae thiotrophic gill symbiont]SHN92220.1 hypothetical protein BHECKSOX_372 [Bathymodiolus heckerae thiotrophic gill symbiont]
MSDKVFEFTIRVFWRDDKKYGGDLIEEIDFYDSLKTMVKIVDPDLDDLEFMYGGYNLNQSQISFFESLLQRKIDLDKYVYQFSRYDFDGKSMIPPKK